MSATATARATGTQCVHNWHWQDDGDIELLANTAVGSAYCWDKAELHGCAKLVELGMLLGCRPPAAQLAILYPLAVSNRSSGNTVLYV